MTCLQILTIAAGPTNFVYQRHPRDICEMGSLQPVWSEDDQGRCTLAALVARLLLFVHSTPALHGAAGTLCTKKVGLEVDITHLLGRGNDPQPRMI
jgi:hypothetical protein